MIRPYNQYTAPNPLAKQSTVYNGATTAIEQQSIANNVSTHLRVHGNLWGMRTKSGMRKAKVRVNRRHLNLNTQYKPQYEAFQDLQQSAAGFTRENLMEIMTAANWRNLNDGNHVLADAASYSIITHSHPHMVIIKSPEVRVNLCDPMYSVS